MRTRTVPIQVFLSEKEAERLKNLTKDSGYSISAYVRSLLNGHIPQSIPPPDYYAMMRELHRIGTNLNQIAQKAHVLNVVDAGRYDVAVKQFIEALRTIEEAVLLPKKLE